MDGSAGVEVVGSVTELYRSPEHDAAAGTFEVTVAVCFASSRDTLAATISSLRDQVDAPTFELLLVSNATTDDSVEVARAAARGLPTRIVECRSAGYDSNARNVSMVEAAADKILFVDSDDLVDAVYVGVMSSALDRAPIVTSVWSLERLNAGRFPELHRMPGTDTSRWPFRYQGWTFAPAGTLGFRREVPATVGGFDPELTYGANNEWCFRAYAAGYELVVVPEAVLHYRLRPSTRETIRQRYRWGVAEVAAAKAAAQYGLPPRTGARALGLGTYSRLLLRLVRIRTAYDWFDFLSTTAAAAGHVTGSVRYRRLDL
ncbi:hypothetical protein N866_04075 [Actinotalea ferrariae CF5-4]|uniref:Glycosyltransferase 2-like domain-containing protein n=1 Tax=Actinotalea ferrariae CF5-4 TaxID=948458 RepID=A0A021VPA4_9CELL|nr:glycosyltransferase family A protein [Actinotalea ferrariae]EYR62948.1 hypothetical protein N866_04075 [Actinotalea ferrariae CF5-4]